MVSPIEIRPQLGAGTRRHMRLCQAFFKRKLEMSTHQDRRVGTLGSNLLKSLNDSDNRRN
jgi:hypothetical protein